MTKSPLQFLNSEQFLLVFVITITTVVQGTLIGPTNEHFDFLVEVFPGSFMRANTDQLTMRSYIFRV